jgi:hypothetical protein
MKHILAATHRQMLGLLLRRRTLFAFDFDGTLAPITTDREAAQMRPSTRDLFTRLCTGRLVAVISGRSLADLERRLADARPTYLVGNHGIEPGANLAQYRKASPLRGGSCSSRWRAATTSTSRTRAFPSPCTTARPGTRRQPSRRSCWRSPGCVNLCAWSPASS